MSLETLLEAARYVELQEMKRERVASTSSSSDHSFVVAPHSNHHNSNEPRGTKIKKERTEPDDLFCEEKMLIIDEEDPIENNKRNGHSVIFRESPVISRGPLMNQNVPQTIIHHTGTPHHQIIHQNNHNNTVHNTYVDNHNVNHAQGSTVTLNVDVDSTQDNKKNRNGPCVIRSGTREVHNKLEKNRRAHLKECFELLKKQLPAQDEKKSSNLSILAAAISHIQTLRNKEIEYELEMERLAREKISSQQRLIALKKELSSKWDHIDFNELLPEQIPTVDSIINKNVTESMDVDVTSLARGGTIYSSTSSLSSSSVTASSPQNHQTSTTSSIHSQVATAAVVCQTQGLNLANNSRESPPTISSPNALIPSIPTPAQEKVNNSNLQQSHQIHLPINAQVLNTNQSLATIMPALQHLGPGLRVIPGDTRQLLVTHSTNNNETRPLTLSVQNTNDQTRPLIAVQSNSSGEPRPVALVVHSSSANDNRVTFVHSNLSNQERPIALAVHSTTSSSSSSSSPLSSTTSSSSNDVRPVTFVHSANEGRPLVLATHPVTTTQTRIRSVDAQTSHHKMIGGITLVGGNGSESTRLSGGAELNILPSVFRSVKSQPITVQGGLALSHTGLSLQSSSGKPGSSVIQTTSSSDGLAHIVTQHSSLTGLTPMTVVSQGNQVTAHILAPSNLAGKMITTPIIKSVGQVSLVDAQYLNTALVKPVVVVSTSSNSTTSSTIPSSTQPIVTSHSNV